MKAFLVIINMKYSNFKITHTVDRGKREYPLIVATLDVTEEGSWSRKPKTRTITVFKEYTIWKLQETGLWCDHRLQCWIEAQETLACIPTA